MSEKTTLFPLMNLFEFYSLSPSLRSFLSVRKRGEEMYHTYKGHVLLVRQKVISLVHEGK